MDFLKDHHQYIERLEKSLSRFSDLDLARKRLTYIRWKVAEDLDKFLFEFETNVRKTDKGIYWCPDAKITLDVLNQQTKNFSRVKFYNHAAVKHMVNETDIKLPETVENPEVAVIGAKFIMANTGNFYTALQDTEEYNEILKARKIVVIAGIDSVLASQAELPLAKQLYATFETGDLAYPAEFIGRSGRLRGLNSEIVVLLTDNNKSKLLEMPAHRYLFSLMNFSLPPVCPMQRIDYDPADWKKPDTLSKVFHAFTHGLQQHPAYINGNYGLHLISQYLPYDIDLYEQMMDARSLYHLEDKRSKFSSLFDSDKSAIVFNPKKFKDTERFRKYAEHNFFGK